MVASRSGRWMALSFLGAVVLATAVACASGTISAPQVQPDLATDTHRLTGVRVDSGDSGSIVTLSGLEDPVYTAFLHSEPWALVLDLKSVEIATENDLVMVYDGLIENVTVSTYGGGVGESLTRVEIALAQDASYEIVSTPDGLLAVVSGSGAMAADDLQTPAADEMAMNPEAPSEFEEDPWSDPQAEEIQVPENEAVIEAAPVQAPAAPATALTGIDYSETSSGVLIHLEADGSIQAMETFRLSAPDRLVVDLPGLSSQVDQATLSLATPQVSQVRVGAHPDKVRVVIDGGEGAGGFKERRIMPANDGLYLALGTGPDLVAALAAAMTTGSMPVVAVQPSVETVVEDEGGSESADLAQAVIEAEPVPVAETISDVREPAVAMQEFVAEPATASSRVYGIHYDSGEEFERIVILCDTLVDYDLLAPDPETLVVSMRDSMVAPDATGRVLVRANRPISLISTFQQPDVAVPEVRVVVKRAAGLEPSVVRHGSMIFVDFPVTGRVAAAAPAFTTEAEWAAAGLGGEARLTAISDRLEVSDDAAAIADSFETEMKASESLESPASMGAPVGRKLEKPAPVAPLSVPAPGPAALEPPAAAEILAEGGLIDGKEYEGRRISLDFKDVPVTDVLRLIAEVSDLNLIAGDEVEGSVTIRLVDVPWDQALDVILLTKGLGFVRVGNVLRIAPTDILKSEEELRLQERRNKETLEDLVVKLHPVNYANVADMSELVKRLLTPRGTVNVDVRTNTVIIKDIPSVIDEATALIKAVDTETPQVLIEAKIVEAALDFSRELGSVWSAGTQPLEDGFDSGSGPRSDLGGPDFRFHDANNVIFGNPITSVPTGLLNMSAFVLSEDFNIDVQIQAAESTGDGKVISSPRVLTLDNREAEIQQGVSIPFQTFENGDAKLEFIDAVLSLVVTPHVTSDNTIIMKVEVTRNAPDDSVPTITGSPAIARAEARTECLIKDGQTLVIGGIYTVTESERERSVPYLNRIPLIGAAFKSREVTDQRKELLIFVTPRIVLASELAGNGS